MTALEQHAAGLALALALGVQLVVIGDVPTRRYLVLATLAGVAVAVLSLGPRLLHPLSAEQSFWHSVPASGSDISGARDASFRWLFDAGLIPLVAGVLAGGWALVQRRTRWIAAPLVVLVGGGFAFTTREAPLLAPDARVAWVLLALAALASLCALALQMVAVALARARVPYAETATGGLVVFYFTLVLMNAEDSSFLADRRAQHAAEAWTDEALDELPPDSALLVRSPALLLRL
jgi:hypothetical protein